MNLSLILFIPIFNLLWIEHGESSIQLYIIFSRFFDKQWLSIKLNNIDNHSKNLLNPFNMSALITGITQLNQLLSYKILLERLYIHGI